MPYSVQTTQPGPGRGWMNGQKQSGAHLGRAGPEPRGPWNPLASLVAALVWDPYCETKARTMALMRAHWLRLGHLTLPRWSLIKSLRLPVPCLLSDSRLAPNSLKYFLKFRQPLPIIRPTMLFGWVMHDHNRYCTSPGAATGPPKKAWGRICAQKAKIQKSYSCKLKPQL